MIRGMIRGEEPHLSAHHIHIVDNDAMAALVTQLGLQSRLQAEAAITTTSDLSQGLPTDVPRPVDLLIVDPGAQSQAATALVRRVQEYYPDTPVLVLTAYDSPMLRAQMRQLGVQSYLAKPVGVVDLEMVVRTMMTSRRKETLIDAGENPRFRN